MLAAILHLIGSTDILATLISMLIAVVVLSGLYLSLWLISKGQWIGFGDVKLGLALALLLSDWRLAFITLFAANLIGCLIVIPGMIAGKITRKTRVPFGPLLIAGYVISALFGAHILSWYFLAL
jgi:leader peptidase (prepilin peptidase)/N-methyltransferase